FSSRRRHTRFSRDWSSDVCSSDLHELYFGLNGPGATEGRRVFDISIEGALVKDDFDIYLEGFNQPTVLTFQDIVVNDGVLNLDLVASVNNASISGISIFSSGLAPGAPTAVLGSSTTEGPAPLTVDFTA